MKDTIKKCPANFSCPRDIKPSDVFYDTLNEDALGAVNFKDIIPFLELEKKQIQMIIDFIKSLPDDVLLPDLRFMNHIYCLRRPANSTIKIVLDTEVEWLLDAHKKEWDTLQIRKKYPDTFDALEETYNVENEDSYLLQHIKNKLQELINLNKKFKKI